MCYNKEVSLIVFIITIAVVINIINEYKNNKNINYLFMGIFVLSIGLMQLVEFFLHLIKDYNINRDIIIKTANFFIPITILLQFCVCEIYLYYTKKLPKETCIIDIIMYLLLFYLIYKVFEKNRTFENKKECTIYNIGCRMSWDITNYMRKISYTSMVIMYLIYMSYTSMLVYYLLELPYFIFYVITGFVFIVLPSFLNFFTNYNIKGSGSLWCLLCIVFICIFVASNVKIIKNQEDV